MAKPPILVLGFGGNSIDAMDTIGSWYEIVAFVDDDLDKQRDAPSGIRILSRAALDEHPDVKVVCLIGSERNFLRTEQIIGSFNIPAERFATIVHPSAHVSEQSRIGRGVIILPNVTITSNANIGNHVLILPNSVIHHDVTVEDYAIICANVVIAGHVNIGRSCYIGSASSIRNGTEVGAGSMVGMAANVIRDVGPGSTVVGNPARVIERPRR